MDNEHRTSALQPSSSASRSWRYIIRMNHSDVPPTPLLLDLFDVSPTANNGLGYYRDYWFFANLQFALDRALLGMRSSVSNTSSSPAVVHLLLRPFPWPATVEDLGAASAAAFLNLLLVFAFLPPTRAACAQVVRERELRLREGMKILGGDSMEVN